MRVDRVFEVRGVIKRFKEIFGLPSPFTDAKGPADYYGIGSAYS